MRDVLRTMREREMHLSLLHPFAQVFYRAYGWELATETIAYTSNLPTSRRAASRDASGLTGRPARDDGPP